MRRLVVCVWLVVLILQGSHVVVAQTPSEVAEPVAVVSEQPKTPPPPNLGDLERLQRTRDRLLARESRPDERRFLAELLLSEPSADARAIILGILGLPQQVPAKRAICEVMASGNGDHPERLDATYAEPLTAMLGAEDADLRAIAARALSAFPGDDIPASLVAIAGKADAPMMKRLAAIDALAPRVLRQDVVRRLVSLLDVDAPSLQDRIVDVLEAAAGQSFESDPARCRAWWATKADLSHEEWLGDRLAFYHKRLGKLEASFDAYRDRSTKREAQLSSRVANFQRDVFRSLGGEEQDASLARWLADPLDRVKLTSLDIITARIADEGKRPEADVLSALLHLLASSRGSLQRDVLLIVQNLDDPAVVDAVLALLETNLDAETRVAIFKTIGKLESPITVAALVRELGAVGSSLACIREAAFALGKVADKADLGERRGETIEHVNARFLAAEPDDVGLRAALLSAMAGIADVAFAPALLGALESNEANLVRPAMRGLRAIKDRSKLPRMRDLTGHNDPLVRREAVEAIGDLGAEEADLQALLTRLNASVESSVPVQDAAWRGFCALLDARPPVERVEAAKRLRDIPTRESAYLLRLVAELSGSNGESASLEAVRDRLADLLIDQGDYAEAVMHLRELCGSLEARSDEAAACGLRLLYAMLRLPDPAGVGALIVELATARGADGRNALREIVATYLDSPVAADDSSRMERLIVELRTVSSDLMGPDWPDVLSSVAKATEKTPPADAGNASP